MLFSRRITLRERGFRREPASPRRTVVALLGLQRLADSGKRQPFDLPSIESAVFQDKRWVKGIGDLGILVQFAAEYSPDRLASLADHFDFASALESFPDGREARTAALSCFLGGHFSRETLLSRFIAGFDRCGRGYLPPLRRQSGTGGIFAHAGLPGLLQQPFSNRFGTITDQMHAIYALTHICSRI